MHGLQDKFFFISIHNMFIFFHNSIPKNRTIGPWLIWDLIMKSGRFHMKSTGYLAFSGRGVLGEICQISWSWNLADFIESGGFHDGIQQISWSWNLADFMKSGGFHPWNLADFMSDLEKCKLENVKFLKHLSLLTYIHWINNSLAIGSPRWVYDWVQYQVSKFNNRDRRAILRFCAKWLTVKKYMW